MECDDAKPKWAVDHGLKLCGQYFQGFVDDYKAALSHHTMETVTSYEVRRSRRNAGGSSTAKHLLQSSVKENNEPKTSNPKTDRNRNPNLNMSKVRLKRYILLFN